MSQSCPTIDNQHSITKSKAIFEENLTQYYNLHSVAETAATACNNALEAGFTDLEGLQLALFKLDSESSALKESLNTTSAEKLVTEQEIQTKTAEQTAIQTQYDEAVQKSTAFLSQPGRTLAESKKEFDEHYDKEITPLAKQLDQVKMEVQFLTTVKAQRENEEAECQAQIQAKGAEISQQQAAIEAQSKTIAALKAQFVVKLTHLRACSGPINFAEELCSKNAEIARLTQELNALRSQQQTASASQEEN